MPLVRRQVRNEYGLGTPELYKAANKDDPKAILDGVAVSGLVGILRQLGDLAEFAGEVFHGLQEQVMATASRSHKIMVRVQHIEAALPPLEKSVMTQKSHIHFAYTTGLDWHANIQTEQNHLLNSDLPQFILDSYEECRDPPRLHLLDKFDAGGPGACLKRYSDPSYFKRAMANSELMNADKSQKDKKARKSKKKGSRRRNGEFPHTELISRRNGRTQFAPSNIYGKSSAANVISNFNMRSTSELGDQSFDLRTRSDYAECVSNGSPSMQTNEHKHSALSSSKLRMQSNDVHSSVVDEQDGVSDDDFLHVSVQGRSAPNSSSVMWYEKTEIVEPTGQPHDHIVDDQHEASELRPMNFDLNKLAKRSVSLENHDADGVSSGDENIIDGNRPDASFGNVDTGLFGIDTQDAGSVGNQLDEIGSEPDNYVDALNTMESETDTDIECQTKREVELPTSSSKNTEMEYGAGLLCEMTNQSSDSYDVDSHTASYCPPNKQLDKNFADMAPKKDMTCVQTPHIYTISSNAKVSEDTESCENINFVNVSRVNDFEVANDQFSLSSNIPNSQAPSSHKIMDSSKSKESQAEVSGGPSIQFWTNGGLLGLEPSKPPDFSISNIPSQNPICPTEDESHDLAINTVRHTSQMGGSFSKLDTLIKTPEHREKDPSSVGENYVSPNASSPTDLHPNQVAGVGNKYQKTDSSECLRSFHDDDTVKRKDSSELATKTECAVMTTGVESPGSSEVKAPTDETGKEKVKNASGVFSLGNRLLVNGFQRKESSVHGDTSKPAPSSKTDAVNFSEPPSHEQKKGQQGVTHPISPKGITKEKHHSGFPANSLPPSPPLEHMKISFHPTNGFETSKLRLKFPDGCHSNENIRDVIFASFHLLPEPDIPRRDTCSDSDNDTFCRSSPYMSEDLSPRSESNSEQWESGETRGSIDHKLCDALHRVSSAESISSSSQLGGASHGNIYPDCELKNLDTEDAMRPFHSGPSLDFPSFDAVSPPTNKQELRSGSEQKDLPESRSHNSQEPTPPPPPFPPVRCVINCHLDVVEAKEGPSSEAIVHPKNLDIVQSTTSQPLSAPPKPPSVKEATACPPNKKQGQQKLNGRKEVNQDGHVKEVDERDDLLHQIRTKSFNLRRTTPKKPNFSSGPTTNVKVAAILEKANAIRQAVGSDEEGDDDSWSDDD
ncbi:PREDICTED: protein SCAR3 [Nelumbo nucifera]|uniref:Protein SCAR n=1 Tax=Nelumbo nucifera TaxID=4432 RepID=A0A1U8B7L4_NELNU|nr:PREDICTED: protein SCAR3 [Nelumbo nucifera]